MSIWPRLGAVCRDVRILACLVALLAAAPALSLAATPLPWTPERLASAIEREVQTTSAGDLDRFGEQSLRLAPPERLRRLDWVASSYVWGADQARFRRWNQILRREANAAGLDRYRRQADLYDLEARYFSGDASVTPRFEQLARNDSDWFSRVHAMNDIAYDQVRRNDLVAALQTLVRAEAQVPGDDIDSRIARSRLLTTRGAALMRVQDPSVSAALLGRSRFELAPRNYPNPDFSDIYTLGLAAVRDGDWKLAADMAARHHALTLRAQAGGSDEAAVWDAYLCALVNEAKNPRATLACIGNDDLSRAGHRYWRLAPRLLQLRALAHARLLDAPAARRDHQALLALKKSGAFGAGGYDRLPLIQAALLRAEGRGALAYDHLLAYAEQRWNADAVQLRAGNDQVIREMQSALDANQRRLAEAGRLTALQQTVIAERSRQLDLVLAVALVVLLLLLWQLRTMRQLRQARAAAEAASRSKSRFVANVSHELRTPLNGILAGADLLAASAPDARSHEMAAIIRDSGLSLNRLITDLLDIRRIEEGRMVIAHEPYGPAQLVRTTQALFAAACQAKGVELRIDIAPDAEVEIMGDGQRVGQILTNLVSNAVKFTAAGQICVRLQRLATDRMRWVVEDTGLGFDAANKAQIFGRFEQADTSIAREYGGSGLGLSLCRELAVAMGGTIDCESTPGVGSRFWVDLPMAVAPNSIPATAAIDPPIPDIALDGARVLLADDHPINRRLVEAILGDEVVLVSASDGIEALAAFQAERFDVVLLDMQMPGLDGLAAARRMRDIESDRDGKRTPILILSANAMPEHIAAATQAGADGHVAKPFTAQTLRQGLGAVLAEATTQSPKALASA